jgi:lipopolysaccharide export system permease protein
MRLLDRYILMSWLRIFVMTVLGLPLITILINLTDNLNRLLDRGLTPGQIAISYVYTVPEHVFLIMPAAVLFATVFTVGTLSRNSELTAAKAGGVSFLRMARPMFIAAAVAAVADIAVGEVAVGATAKQVAIQRGDREVQTRRYNFVYRGDGGWVYTIGVLDTEEMRIQQVLLEREGSGTEYPALVITADSGRWVDSIADWRLYDGASRIIAGPERQATFRFADLSLAAMDQPPDKLLLEPKSPEEMRYGELGDYIETLRRSGNDVSKLEVERALKLSLPVTCLIIALFGAPVAVTNPRAGAAVGIAISLGTTVVFLMLAQIARAVGAGGVIDPTAAAWLPNGVFLAAALVMLGRVRS